MSRSLGRAEALPVAGSATAWLALVAAAAFGWPTALRMPGMHAAPVGEGAVPVPGVVVMVVGMMLPLAIPGVVSIRALAPWWRRGRAIGLFLAAWLATWCAASILISVLGPRLLVLLGTSWPLTGAPLTIAFAGCAAWQVAPVRGTLGRRCRRVPLLRPAGITGYADVAVYGCRAAGWCAALCAPAMSIMLAGGAGDLALMLTVMLVAIADRVALAGTNLSRPEAWLAGIYLLLAAAVVVSPM